MLKSYIVSLNQDRYHSIITIVRAIRAASYYRESPEQDPITSSSFDLRPAKEAAESLQAGATLDLQLNPEKITELEECGLVCVCNERSNTNLSLNRRIIQALREYYVKGV